MTLIHFQNSTLPKKKRITEISIVQNITQVFNQLPKAVIIKYR